MSKRYYWLKLNENFFDRDEVKVIEDMPNGKDYIIFYLKLLLKSIQSEGELLFRKVIPYTPEMLSSITNTDIDTVRVAIDLFNKLELMEIWDDGTLFMTEIENMVGSESESAQRVRRHRKKQALKDKKEQNMLQSNDDVIKSNTEIDIEKEKDIDIKNSASKDTHIIFFEKMWKLYPNKKNKGQISNSKKKEIEKLDQEFERCIKRYIADVEQQRKNGFPELRFKVGSTFFNSGYIDYLDSNYKDTMGGSDNGCISKETGGDKGEGKLDHLY